MIKRLLSGTFDLNDMTFDSLECETPGRFVQATDKILEVFEINLNCRRN